MKNKIYKTQEDILERVLSGNIIHSKSIKYSSELDIGMKLEGLSKRINIEDETILKVIDFVIDEKFSYLENSNKIMACIKWMDNLDIERIIDKTSHKNKIILGILEY